MQEIRSLHCLTRLARRLKSPFQGHEIREGGLESAEKTVCNRVPRARTARRAVDLWTLTNLAAETTDPATHDGQGTSLPLR